MNQFIPEHEIPVFARRYTDSYPVPAGRFANHMSSVPAVSVIIPVYKATRYIPEALDSLRAQTFRDFEAILVNDGCPDTANLEKALEPYKDEIVYFSSGKWASVSESRNKGIAAARGRYIAFLDADDTWEPEYLAVQVAMLEADPSIDVVYPNATYIGIGTAVGKAFMDVLPSEGEVTLEAVLLRRCTVFIGATSRKEVLIRSGLFDPEKLGSEDLDLWIRVLRNKGRIVYHRQLLANYRISLTHQSSDRFEAIRRSIRMLDKHLAMADLSSAERGWFEAAHRKQSGWLDLYMGKRALYQGNFAEATERLGRASESFSSWKLRLAVIGLRLTPGLIRQLVRKRYPDEYAFLG